MYWIKKRMVGIVNVIKETTVLTSKKAHPTDQLFRLDLEKVKT